MKKLVYVGKIEKIIALLKIDKLFQGDKKLTLKEYLEKYGNIAYYEKLWGDIMKKLVYCGKIDNVLAMLKLDITLAKLNQKLLQGENKPTLKTYLENTKIFWKTICYNIV